MDGLQAFEELNLETPYPQADLGMKTNSQVRCCLVFVLGASFFAGGCESKRTSNVAPSTPTNSARAPQAVDGTKDTDLSSDPKGPARFYTVDHYGIDRNAEEDLKMTLARANSENKRVLLQVGGDWCGWCKLLTGFIESNEKVRAAIDKDYLVMKVTFTSENKNEAFLSKFPSIKGYPHLFVLDKDGSLLHSQDTGVLEQGKGYNEEEVLSFLGKWKPE